MNLNNLNNLGDKSEIETYEMSMSEPMNKNKKVTNFITLTSKLLNRMVCIFQYFGRHRIEDC